MALNGAWGKAEGSALKKINQFIPSREDVYFWSKQLLSALKKDQHFIVTDPNESDMSLHLGVLSREIGIPEKLRKVVIEETLSDIYAYGILTPLVLKQKVTTIWIYGDSKVMYSEGGKRKEYDNHFNTIEDLYRFIEKRVLGTTFRYARNIPEVKAILADGIRMHVMQGSAGISMFNDKTGSVTKAMPIVTLRLFSYPYNMKEIIKNDRLRTYLSLLSMSGKSYVISGNQGAGKTTLLNASTELIPKNYNIILIEDTPEMQPLFKGAVTRLWNNGNEGDFNHVSMIKNTIATLKMTGDVMFIGEIQDEETMSEFLRISNIGLFLTAATLHSNTGIDTLTRMETLATAASHKPPEKSVRDQIARGVTHIIHMHREGADSGLQEVGEVTGIVDGEIGYRKVFTRDIVTGDVEFYGLSDSMRKEAIKNGLLDYFE